MARTAVRMTRRVVIVPLRGAAADRLMLACCLVVLGLGLVNVRRRRRARRAAAKEAAEAAAAAAAPAAPAATPTFQ